MSTYTYHVPDITCENCIAPVVNAFDSHELLKHCVREVELLDKTLNIYINDNDERLKHLTPEILNPLVNELLEEVGFSAKPRWRAHGIFASIGLVAGFGLLALSLFFPAAPLVMTAIMAASSILLTLFLGWPFYRRAYYGLMKGNFTMDTLFSLSTAIIIGVALAAFFVPGLPMMLEAGLLIFGFRHAGIAISDAFKSKLVSTKKLQDDLPREVTRLNAEGLEEKVLLDEIKPGDVLVLSVGDMLPVDGVFESGEGLISNVYQTGVGDPLALKCNEVYAAGTNLLRVSSPICFCATSSSQDSFLAREDKAIQAAKLKQKPLEAGLNKLLKWFVPIVMAAALISAVFVGVFLASWILALQVMVCVLVAACPCTLGLITPLVTHVGLKKSAEHGVMFKETEKLALAHQVDAVMFDLNGTITSGKPYVKDAESCQDLLQLMAHLEAGSKHWVAQALKAAVVEPLNSEVSECIASSRYGLHASYQGCEYHLGNSTMMEQLGIASNLPEVEVGLGESVIYLAKDKQYIGHVVIVDGVREGTHHLIHQLQQIMGKEVYICTGADKKTALRFARALNICDERVFWACSIEDKQTHLKALQEKGKRVMFVGDAGNDGLVTSASDVGGIIAHHGGHEGAQQGASFVLHSESLAPLEDLFEISRQTDNNLKQNLGFSFIYNAAAVFLPMVCALAAGIILNPAVGAALMMLQTLLIFVNVYRFSVADTKPSRANAVEAKQSLSTSLDGNSNVFGVGNRMGLTYANTKVLDAKNVDETVGNEVTNGFDEVVVLRPH